jgi:hypothetical protein
MFLPGKQELLYDSDNPTLYHESMRRVVKSMVKNETFVEYFENLLIK